MILGRSRAESSSIDMSKLSTNFIYNITYQILVIILPLITAPYVSRVLGVDGVGTYSYIYSIAYYFCLCGMLGVSNHGNRSVAMLKDDRDKLSSTFWAIYKIQFATTMFSLVCYLIFVTFFFSGDKRVAYIDTFYLVSYVLDINWLYFGLEKFKLTVTRNMVFKVLSVVCTFAFVRTADDLWKYTLILSFGTMLSQVYLWIHLFRYVTYKKNCWKEISVQIKPILILFIPVIAYSIYKVMDKIMLGSMSSVQQVGLYENADKIIGIPVGIITAFGTVMMPRISALTSKNEVKQIENYNKLSFKYFSLLSIGMTFGLIGISNILPDVYFGHEFIDCAPLIAGLSFTLIFMTWANIIRTQYLIPNKIDRPYVVSTICGAIVNLLFNFFLIPRFQARGALVGTVLAEFMVFFVQAIYVRKEFFVLQYLKPVIPFIFNGIVMSVIVFFLGEYGGSSVIVLLLQIAVGVVVYLGLSIIYLGIIKDSLITTIVTRIKALCIK